MNVLVSSPGAALDQWVTETIRLCLDKMMLTLTYNSIILKYFSLNCLDSENCCFFLKKKQITNLLIKKTCEIKSSLIYIYTPASPTCFALCSSSTCLKILPTTTHVPVKASFLRWLHWNFHLTYSAPNINGFLYINSFLSFTGARSRRARRTVYSLEMHTMQQILAFLLSLWQSWCVS